MFAANFASVELAVREGSVWALERALGQVTRIDPATRKPKLFAEGVGASSSIAVDGSAVWLEASPATKLDPRTGQKLGSVFVPPVSESATTSIAVGRDAVWFVGDRARTRGASIP